MKKDKRKTNEKQIISKMYLMSAVAKKKKTSKNYNKNE